MNLTSFRGVTFTTLGVTSPKFAAPQSPSADRQPTVIARTGADPVIPGVDAGARVMTFWFTPNGTHVESTFAKVLALCNPDDPSPGTLVGVFNPTSGSTVTVEATAHVGAYSYPDVNTLAVDFILASPWRAQSAATLLSATTFAADGSFANNNSGFRDVLPALTIGMLGRGATNTTVYGYDRKVSFTLTNTGTEPLINYPYQIGPINAATTWVGAGIALANGNDVRIFVEGREWPRNLIGWNTERAFIWIVIPWLAPNQSITVEIVSNNPSASSPPTLTMASSPQRPAIDISGSGYTGSTSTTTTTLTLTGAGWETDQWQGGTIITGVTGAAGAVQMRRIASNTATVLTVTRAWTVPDTAVDFTVIKSGLMGDGGVVSSAGSTTLFDTSQSWRTNEWIGATVTIRNGTGAGQTRTVTSSTATGMVITPVWTTTPDTTSGYTVYRPNGVWMWDTRPVPKTTNHPGLWLTNKTQAPPTQVSFDAPGAWYRFTYQPSNDVYSQPRYASFSVGAGDYDHMPTMYLQRAKRGRVGAQREAGIADAIGVSSPFAINGIFFGYTIRNAKKAGSGSPGEGMCEARFMTQESGGELWSTFLSDVTVHNSSTAVTPAWYDLTGYGTPNRIGVALIPNGSDEIPSSDTNTALLQSSGNHVSLAMDSTDLTSTVSDWYLSPATPVTMGDVYLIIRTGGAAAVKPYDRLLIGAPDHRLFLEYTGGTYTEQITIDCETHIISLVDSSGAFIRRIPYAVQVQEIRNDADGVFMALPNARWLPIPPTVVDSANIYVSDPSGASWGTVRISATGKLGYLT